jgi:hypothetical protein
VAAVAVEDLADLAAVAQVDFYIRHQLLLQLAIIQ